MKRRSNTRALHNHDHYVKITKDVFVRGIQKKGIEVCALHATPTILF